MAGDPWPISWGLPYATAAYFPPVTEPRWSGSAMAAICPYCATSESGRMAQGGYCCAREYEVRYRNELERMATHLRLNGYTVTAPEPKAGPEAT
jgi:hypothetical protein